MEYKLCIQVVLTFLLNKFANSILNNQHTRKKGGVKSNKQSYHITKQMLNTYLFFPKFHFRRSLPHLSQEIKEVMNRVISSYTSRHF